MKKIHSSAVVDPGADIADDVEIGPFSVIENGVSIGRGNVIHGSVCIKSHTTIGENNVIHHGAVLGDLPQSIGFKDTVTRLTIGSGNTFREQVTIHRAMHEGGATVVGDDNFFMVLSHAGHDCQIGNGNILSNCTLLAGHTIVEDGVVMSGYVGTHQFSRIGRLAMLSALTAVNRDIPPFVIAGGRPATTLGLNTIGLRRAGIDRDARKLLKEAFKLFYMSGLNKTQALGEIEKREMPPVVQQFVEFIRASKRGVCRYSDWLKKRESSF